MAPRKNSANAHHSPPALGRALALWREGRFDDAIYSFNEAVRLAPNNPAVLIDAARALGAKYQVDRGLSLLERALRLGPRSVDVQHAVGDSYRMLGRLEDAERCFRRACKLATSPRSQLELAKICERRHALDEAADLVAKVLRLKPRSADALLLRARIERRRGEADQAFATLRQLTTARSVPANVLAEAYGELSVLLDKSGDYDKAWDAILECKRILLSRDRAPWHAAQLMLERCKQMLDDLTADHFMRWRSEFSCDKSHRMALLTGFPRSGTTLLEQVLVAHPDVVETEELEIFSGDVFPTLLGEQPQEIPLLETLDRLSHQQIQDARQRYFSAAEAVLRQPIGSRLYLDKNPAMNLMIPPMRRLFPELKLIVALRDPRDIVVSCFLRYLPLNPVSVYFLTLERTVDRFMLDIGAWLKIRQMVGDWVEIRYEHVIADLRRETARTLELLDVPWDESLLQYHARSPQKQIRSPSYEEVARPIFTTSAGRWKNYERQLEPIMDRLAPFIDALDY